MNAVSPAPIKNNHVAPRGIVQGTKNAEHAAAIVDTPKSHITIVSDVSVFWSTRTHV